MGPEELLQVYQNAIKEREHVWVANVTFYVPIEDAQEGISLDVERLLASEAKCGICGMDYKPARAKVMCLGSMQSVSDLMDKYKRSAN